MGSLEEMYSCLSDVKGLKAIIINNVSTRMAMDAGAKIRSSISLDKIAETVAVKIEVRIAWLIIQFRRKQSCFAVKLELEQQRECQRCLLPVFLKN